MHPGNVRVRTEFSWGANSIPRVGNYDRGNSEFPAISHKCTFLKRLAVSRNQSTPTFALFTLHATARAIGELSTVRGLPDRPYLNAHIPVGPKRVNGLRPAFSRAISLTEMNSEHAWTCGSSKGLECRRFINRGAFGDVYEVSLSSVPLIDLGSFRWSIKSLLGLGLK
jgi:hypothetical protein